ncbi:MULTISPECIES: DUF1127 domain-containing protein [Chelativorans]|jgi:uncharacterized protein YjiS (DUF1127 family)|uniref:YjiS-like domain-containing protein n=1 Tax=Chelativorans sp. (strain BNC1) TaxID=266779 RepID=Q11LY6_CHESB|nr:MULTISPECIES: DUF1127 domain-containing protein [Chelativorans]
MRAEQTIAPITTARPGIVLRLARTVSDMLRLWSNRRAMRRLSELSDWELVDIGLTREDITRAYDGPILNDPTRHLEQIVRARANEECVIRRRP